MDSENQAIEEVAEKHGRVSKERLFELAQPAQQAFPFETLGVDLVIRQVKNSEVERLIKVCTRKVGDKEEQDNTLFQRHIVAAALVEPSLTLEDVIALADQRNDVWDEMVLTVFKYNRIGSFAIGNSAAFRA